jgi:di/tripeptidase
MKTLMRLEPKLFLKVKACILATKGKMINSMLIANDFINALPKKETPETTKGYEGFFIIHHLTGSIGNSFRINNQGPQQAKI